MGWRTARAGDAQYGSCHARLAPLAAGVDPRCFAALRKRGGRLLDLLAAHVGRSSRCWSCPTIGAMRRSFPDRLSHAPAGLGGSGHRNVPPRLLPSRRGASRAAPIGSAPLHDRRRRRVSRPVSRRRRRGGSSKDASLSRTSSAAPIDGFVAPAWLYGEGAMEAFATRRSRWRKIICESGRRRPATKARKRAGHHLGKPDADAPASSLLAAAALRHAPLDVLADRRSPARIAVIRRSFKVSARLSRSAAACRRPRGDSERRRPANIGRRLRSRADQRRRDFQYSSAASASSGFAK